MKTCYLLILLFCFCYTGLTAQTRLEFLLEDNWKFTREDQADAAAVNFNDSKWQKVTIPHDWAIYGPFSSRNDISCLKPRRRA